MILKIMPMRKTRTIKNKKNYIILEVITFLLSIPLGYLCSQSEALNDISIEIILVYVPVSMLAIDYLYRRFEGK